MDVIDDAPLFLQGELDWFGIGHGFLKPIAKFLIGFLKTFLMAEVIAAGLADHEAEGCCDQHPYRHEVC